MPRISLALASGLALVLVAGCVPRPSASPVSPNDSTEPVSVPGVPAAAAELEEGLTDRGWSVVAE